MNANEFEKKLKSLPEQDPDEMDLAMLAQAKAENDGSTVSLESYKKELDEYSGKLVLRIPRSLHKQLKEAAQMEGVSLNQYMLYKLAK
ncbi:MAG: toxin-antitoxin system HicB family antitoxin [Acutalibacter sp.]|jgi:predicted HicB family RNase H-like nuclease